MYVYCATSVLVSICITLLYSTSLTQIETVYFGCFNNYDNVYKVHIIIN